MNKSMTLERATEFGSAWNSGDGELVASFFTEDGVFHSTDGPDHLGSTSVGRPAIREAAQMFFDKFPDGKFENLKVEVNGQTGTFSWDFVANDESGKSQVLFVGCDLLEFRGDMVATKNAYRKVSS